MRLAVGLSADPLLEALQLPNALQIAPLMITPLFEAPALVSSLKQALPTPNTTRLLGLKVRVAQRPGDLPLGT